jgi:hypothetical protein
MTLDSFHPWVDIANIGIDIAEGAMRRSPGFNALRKFNQMLHIEQWIAGRSMRDFEWKTIEVGSESLGIAFNRMR